MGGLVTDRHNALLKGLMSVLRPKFSPSVDIRYDKTCNLAGRRKRPDVVVIDKCPNKAVIIDAACPYERWPNSFVNARNIKLTKYEPEMRALKESGLDVIELPFIVGPLGSWDCANDVILKSLGVSSRALALLKRKCISETIRFSRVIAYKHIFGSRYKPANNSM